MSRAVTDLLYTAALIDAAIAISGLLYIRVGFLPIPQWLLLLEIASLALLLLLFVAFLISLPWSFD